MRCCICKATQHKAIDCPLSWYRRPVLEREPTAAENNSNPDPPDANSNPEPPDANSNPESPEANSDPSGANAAPPKADQSRNSDPPRNDAQTPADDTETCVDEGSISPNGDAVPDREICP